MQSSNYLLTENIVIIGSGPAGYTSAIYAARANLQPLLITGFKKGGIPGGQLMTTTFVENFPGFPNGVLGPDLMDLLKSQALRWGTKLIEEDAVTVDLSKHPFTLTTSDEQQTIKTNALIIATGASARKLNLPKEKRFWTKGISACAICDGATPQFIEEDLAVVGGGDSACEEAVYLTKYGSHVHLLVRSKQLRASAAMADRVLLNSQITVHFETELIDVDGDDWLKTLIIKKKNTEDIKLIQVKGLFYAIGHTPNTELFTNQIELDNRGYVITNPGRPETSLKGVFAAGDVADSEWRQGITAAGSGCKAALAAERWLSQNNLSNVIHRKNAEPKETKKHPKTQISNEKNFKPNGPWQKGSYALRKLYHQSNIPLLVIYTSRSCGPCHVLKPQLKRVIEELKGKVQAVEIDIEHDQDIAKQADITGTPSVQLFLKKELKEQWQGVKQRSVFKNSIIKLIK
tara:strand:- start:1770 stop:3149 length:1380 start_codon:yes stop_codon:yes gene_type:complete